MKSSVPSYINYVQSEAALAQEEERLSLERAAADERDLLARKKREEEDARAEEAGRAKAESERVTREAQQDKVRQAKALKELESKPGERNTYT